MSFDLVLARYGFNRAVNQAPLTHAEIIQARQPFYDDVAPRQARLKSAMFALLFIAFILTVPGAMAVLTFAYDTLASTNHIEHSLTQVALGVFLGGITLLALPLILVRQKRIELDNKYHALRDFAYLSQAVSDNQLQMSVYQQLSAICARVPMLLRFTKEVELQGRDLCLGEINTIITHYLHCEGIETARYAKPPEEQLRALSALLAQSLGSVPEEENVTAAA